MGDVLGDLAELGYDAEWDCVPAVFVGAPHIRNRVFIVAYPRGVGCGQGPRQFGGMGSPQRGSPMANTAASRRRRPSDPHYPWRGTAGTEGRGVRRTWAEHWRTEPDVGRVAHGIPGRVDRLRGLGNAVVPQVAEHIGRMIMETAA
jgi:DNA (cytosine-5)-methyltransferase 1